MIRPTRTDFSRDLSKPIRSRESQLRSGGRGEEAKMRRRRRTNEQMMRTK